MLTFRDIDDLKAHSGHEAGFSSWHRVVQEDIDAFAEVTGDRQWIHTDPERARATPFGGTIAHGYYTLALAPRFIYELFSFDAFAFAMNYGLDKVRFPAPLPVGDRVRMGARLDRVEDVPGGASVVATLTFERDGGDRPVCVAEARIRITA